MGNCVTFTQGLGACDVLLFMICDQPLRLVGAEFNERYVIIPLTWLSGRSLQVQDYLIC
jgi:hypothetical protein